MRIRRTVLALVMAVSAVLLALPGQPVSAVDSGFCQACANRCYQTAENVDDYNACVFLCNYAGCEIPYIN